MYVRVGPFTADPTDSYVQARTAPQTRRQKHLGAGFTSTGNDGAETPSQIFPRTRVLRHTTGIAGPMHPPSTPDEPSMYFSFPAQRRNSRHRPGRHPHAR